MTYDLASGEVVITATEFKAKCLDLLDRVNAGQVRRVHITKRGKTVGLLTAPAQGTAAPWDAQSMFGAMQGGVRVEPPFDLTKPIYEQVYGELPFAGQEGWEPQE